MSKLEVDKIDPQSGTDLELGSSGDTVIIPTGVTLDASNATTTLPANVVTTNGTQTLTNKTIDASQLSGTVATSNLGTGTADATTFLRGDQTYASATPAAGSITTTQLAYNPNPFRNIIINGDMSIAQRGTSTSGISTTGRFVLDRWKLNVDTMGAWTVSQSTDVPTGQGFASSIKWDCTTADASPSASDNIQFQQRFEGQNLQYIKKGTSSAESLTLSFWVKSNKTGTYCISLIKIDNTRYDYIAEYSISSADTWEKKTITIAPDSNIQAAGGAIDNDNGIGFYCQFTLANGSGRQGSNETWNTSTPATSTSNQVNFLDNTANEFYITGVQLEAGTTASDFEFLPYDVNLQRCQRYYSIAKFMTGVGFDATNIRFGASFNPTMRTSPTLGTTGALQFTDGYSADKGQSSGNVSVFDTSAYGVWGQAGNFSSLTTGRAYFGNRFFNSGLISLDAEL